MGCRIAPPWTDSPPKVHRLGQTSTTERLLQALGQIRYVEGRNIAIDYRFGETEARLPELAAKLVRLNVDLIFTNGTPAGLVAKDATDTKAGH